MNDILNAEALGGRRPGPDHVLTRIAAALDCPVQAFSAAPGSDRQTGGAELMRLWVEIANDAGRQRVLACAQVVVELQSGREAAPI